MGGRDRLADVAGEHSPAAAARGIRATSILACASTEDLVLVNHGKGKGVLEEVCHQTMVAAGFERVAQVGYTELRPQNAVSVFASRRLLQTLEEAVERLRAQRREEKTEQERLRARRVQDRKQRRARAREAEEARAHSRSGGADEQGDGRSAGSRPSRVTRWGWVAVKALLLVGAVIYLLRKRR